jgi:UDP-glucose 4-epimerase
VLFAAMGREPSIKIFGNDYPTPDGTCVRDYVHVSDLADAHVAALNWLGAGKPSESFNLGNGLGFSVAEVVKSAKEVTKLSVRTEMSPRRPGDPPVLVSDSGKARELLGWTPNFPVLDQQILHVDVAPPQYGGFLSRAPLRRMRRSRNSVTKKSSCQG